MGLLTDRDANTPVKGGFAKVGKLFKNTAKAPRSQYDAMAPSTPIASSESPAQQAAPSPEPLLGSVSLVFEKPCKLGATFQETPGRLALRVIAYALDSQAREMGVKSGWMVSEINGVSMFGKSFKEAMDMLCGTARPLRVIFATPLMDGDAAKQAAEDAVAPAATASPTAAVEDTKRRLYEHNASAAGGVKATLVEASRNLIAMETPKKDTSALKAQEAAIMAELASLDQPGTNLGPAPSAPVAAAAAPDAVILGLASALLGAPGAVPPPVPAAIMAPTNPFAGAPAAGVGATLAPVKPAAVAAVAAPLANPFAPAVMAAAISSPKVATMETKKRMYTFNAATGGVSCAGEQTECRNMLSLGDTPTKGFSFDSSSSPAAGGPMLDRGVGPYEIAVMRSTPVGDAVMQVEALGKDGEVCTVADIKRALLTQTLAAHQGLLRAPLKITEVRPALKNNWFVKERRDVLADSEEVKGVWDRQEAGVTSLRVETDTEAVKAAEAAAAYKATAVAHRCTPVKETAPAPAVVAEETLDIFASPAPVPAAAVAAPIQRALTIAEELFASPAPVPKPQPSDLVAFENLGGSDWVDFDTPVKGA